MCLFREDYTPRMFGISITNPGLLWAFLGVLLAIIAIIVTVYYSRKSIKNNKPSASNIKQEQNLGDRSTGYQAGGNINVQKDRRDR